MTQQETIDPVTDVPTEPAIATIGLGPLRPAPTGLPDPSFTPPTIAETGDPFAAVRVIHLLARLERGCPVRLADIVDRLNATWLDWLFSVRVVSDVALQLQANWMTDYRNSFGDRRGGWAVWTDPDDRGFLAGRSLDRPPGGARGRLLCGTAG